MFDFESVKAFKANFLDLLFTMKSDCFQNTIFLSLGMSEWFERFNVERVHPLKTLDLSFGSPLS